MWSNVSPCNNFWIPEMEAFCTMGEVYAVHGNERERERYKCGLSLLCTSARKRSLRYESLSLSTFLSRGEFEKVLQMHFLPENDLIGFRYCAEHFKPLSIEWVVLRLGFWFLYCSSVTYYCSPASMSLPVLGGTHMSGPQPKLLALVMLTTYEASS